MKKRHRKSLAMAMAARSGRSITVLRASSDKSTAIAVKSGNKPIIKMSNGIAIV